MNKVELNYIWQDKKRWLFFGLPLTFTNYGLTEEKLIIKKGFFTLVTDEVRLYRILDLSLKQTLIQRIFNLGTISVTSNDRSLGNFELKNIKNPEVTKELLSKNVEEERIKKRISGREYMYAEEDVDDEIDE